MIGIAEIRIKYKKMDLDYELQHQRDSPNYVDFYIGERMNFSCHSITWAIYQIIELMHSVQREAVNPTYVSAADLLMGSGFLSRYFCLTLLIYTELKIRTTLVCRRA